MFTNPKPKDDLKVYTEITSLTAEQRRRFHNLVAFATSLVAEVLKDGTKSPLRRALIEYLKKCYVSLGSLVSYRHIPDLNPEYDFSFKCICFLRELKKDTNVLLDDRAFHDEYSLFMSRLQMFIELQEEILNNASK